LIIPVCAFSKEEGKTIKDPIVITSKMLIIDSRNNTAVFKNSVVAEIPEMTLYAEKMIVFYNKTTGNVTRVDALGGIKLVEKDSVITADEATYYALDERVTFKGDLKVVDKKHFVSDGQRSYPLDRGRASVDDSTSDLKK
jgi:lipopolysaccharide export system protein LptA